MITRRFGRTNLAMPVFSCGGMRYQHSWSDAKDKDIPEESQKNLEATIRRAIEVGINHIETARGYGSSEMQLGKILPQIPRESLIVQTKVGPKKGGAAEFTEVFNASMKNLRLDYVDLLGIHGINNKELLEETLKPGGSLEAARQLQKEGRAHHIGFSTHAPLETIMEAIKTGEFDYVNLHWYWVNQVNWPAIVEANRRNVGVFIISPNDKGGKLYEPPDKLVRLCQPFSPMVFNDLFCLARPEVHTLSLGAARPTDFDEHLSALPYLEQAAEAVAPVVTTLLEEMFQVLGRSWCENWSEGLPSWEEVPGEVNLREIVRLWNFDEALEMREFSKMRYNLLGQGGHWFPGRNAEKMDADSIRALLGQHLFPDRVLEVLRDAHARFYEAPKNRLSKS